MGCPRLASCCGLGGGTYDVPGEDLSPFRTGPHRGLLRSQAVRVLERYLTDMSGTWALPQIPAPRRAADPECPAGRDDLRWHPVDCPSGRRPLTTLAAGRSQSGTSAASRPAQAGAVAEPLTGREMEVLWLLCGSLTRREIAAELGLSPNTVKTQVQAIYRKLGVGTRRAAIIQGQDTGVLRPAGSMTSAAESGTQRAC